MTRFKHLSLTLAVATLAMATGPMTAYASEGQSFAFRFNYDRADVENPETAIRVYDALSHKVERACRDRGIGLIEQRTAATQTCAQKALDRAIADIDADALSDVHARRTF